ncbi:MAG TPA: 50S ribosomal protein L6 [Anaerolineales bacterium]|nr:50S ribosomal protein L6 [Anaerolineales bacterium]
MSRIGRLPIPVPANVQVDVKGSFVRVKGPKGTLEYTFPAAMDITLDQGELTIKRPSDAREHRSLHGTTRALLHNMVVGVSTGFQTVLEINGVGYRAEVNGKNLVLNVGYSHPVVVEPPDGISFDVDAKTRQVKVMGADKQQVGQIAANIREIRPPEPYLGKGIKYVEEKIRRKAGKSGKG